MDKAQIDKIEIDKAKAALREQAHAQRDSLSIETRGEAARAAAQHFLDGVEVPADAVVALYWPIRDELDSRPLLTALMDAGQPVCLPVVLGIDRPLELRLWLTTDPLYPAGFGTLAPPDSAPRVEPDLVVMPLLGFDRAGTRLGYGGGYYDRTLARLKKRPLLVGYAFAAQQLGHIPREPHDIPLDLVVTEAGVRRFGGRDDGK
ncbi:MAG TPA: 5-formyltetrahydrofolate cyclo-ligase [Devosiaceae bacterium]